MRWAARCNIYVAMISNYGGIGIVEKVNFLNSATSMNEKLALEVLAQINYRANTLMNRFQGGLQLQIEHN